MLCPAPPLTHPRLLSRSAAPSSRPPPPPPPPPRAEGKTDYQARRALVVQDKNKYAAPKYRLVARITNHYVIAQIVCSELNGDRVVAAANSAELRR
jgi:large subunit ribosomal protein L5e